MENQVLSIEQMQHLYDLGVDNSKASMCWIMQPGSNVYEVSVYDEYCHEMSCLNPVPTFTLQDMLEMMPKSITVKDKRLNKECSFYDKNAHTVSGLFSIDFSHNSISYSVYGYEGIDLCIPYIVEAFDTSDGEIWYDIQGAPIKGATLLESAYIMLCWLAENKYLN